MTGHVILMLACLVSVAHPWGHEIAGRIMNAQDVHAQQMEQFRQVQQQMMQQQVQQHQQHMQQLQQMQMMQQQHQLSQMQQMQQQRSALLKNAQCFGLARRTRRHNVEMPILYNVKTKDTAPIPRFLYNADQNVIAKMESDGWEVRTRRICVPYIVYERMPVCCPWDAECIQNGGVPTSPRPSMSSPASRSPCANGGQLIYKDGQQKCECPPGFKGKYCQAPDLIGRMRVTASQGPFADMVREADMWRRQVVQSRQNQVMSSDPMLSPRDHLIASMAGPWAQRAAMWHQQALRQRMGEQWAQAVQGATSPYEAMLAMQRNGGNPYGAMDPRVRGQMTRNPYNEMPSQGQLPPNMQSAVYAIQQEIRQRGNPYSQQQVDPRIAAILRNNDRRDQRSRPPFAMPPPQARTPWDLDPFNKQVPGFMRDARQGPQSADPRQLMAMAMYQRLMAQNGPRGMGIGRPPMGMPSTGPMGMGRPSETPLGIEGYPNSEPALPANMDNGQANEDETMMQGQAPPLMQGQPMETMAGTGPVLQVTGSNGRIQVTGGQMPGMVQQGQMPGMVQQGQMPGMVQGQMPGMVQGQMPGLEQQGQMPGMGQQGPMSGMGQGQLPGMGQGPMDQQGPIPAMGGQGGQGQMPTPEELEQIQKCQGILQPKLDECISQPHKLTLEQFMNPEYMETAKGVCEDSEAVGGCLMQLDTVCGDDAIMTTRKMLNSVLQMMSMVCEQIMARGNTQIPPMQGGGLAQMPLPGSTIPNGPRPALQDTSMPHNPSMPAVPETPMEQPQFTTDEYRGQEPGAAVVEDPSLFKTPAIESKHDDVPVPTKAASTGDNHVETSNMADKQTGHDSAKRVSKELEVMGLPLWLGISILLVAFIVVFLLFMVACICIRRCRNSKEVQMNKEIEKLPEPLDNASKLYTVGIPPPSYTTTAVQLNEDGLALPPLDLDDDASVTVVNEKPPLEEDADDESDEKEEAGSIKKKEKKKDQH